MYCPKCSQQKISDEMRFCSRCGFSLSAVRELIASGSAIVEHGAEAQAGQLSQSQRGVRKGACMMIAGLVLTVVVGVLSRINDDFAVLIQRVETAEMVQPPSVTENTTRFLDEESGPRRG
jgi:uncharacterized membrane protein YvbJ